MRFYGHERLALLVDGPNTWHAGKALGFEIDYGKLQDLFARQGTLVASRYFTRMADTEDFNPVHPLVQWLGFNGWAVTTRDKDTDVDLAIFAMELLDHVDHLILASGDGDYCALVDAYQRRGRRVSIVSTVDSRPMHCSDDLRCGADQFMELSTLRSVIERPAREPQTARKPSPAFAP